jgi:hypothetical protein
MEWWLWLLIGVGVVALGIVKVKVGGAWLRKQAEKRNQVAEEYEE